MPEHFAKDHVHFNESGKKLYACNVAAYLSNFTRRFTNVNM